MIPYLQTLPHTDRLIQLKLPSLPYRRKRGDMIQLYKIIQAIDSLDSTNFFEPASYRGTGGYNYKLRKTRCRLDIRKYCFSQRNTVTVHVWNGLPHLIVNSESVNLFKVDWTSTGGRTCTEISYFNNLYGYRPVGPHVLARHYASRYNMIWYDMIWYDMIWYDSVNSSTSLKLSWFFWSCSGGLSSSLDTVSNNTFSSGLWTVILSNVSLGHSNYKIAIFTIKKHWPIIFTPGCSSARNFLAVLLWNAHHPQCVVYES